MPPTTDRTKPEAAQGLCLGIVIVVLSVMLFVFGRAAFSDGDIWWHLASGRFIVEHGFVPTTDPFSFSARGQTWVTHEWLAEVLMQVTYTAFGWKGVALVHALAFASAMGLIFANAQRWLPPVPAASLTLLAMFCLIPQLHTRPHVLALVPLSVWLVLLMRTNERKAAPSPAWALLMLVWANLHASYMFGLALAGAFGLAALIEAKSSDRLHVIRSWGTFGIALLIACMITPSGPKGLLYPFMVSGMEILNRIGEWRPTDFSEPGYFSIYFYFMLFFCLLRPVRVPVIQLLILLAALHLALKHVRHQELFAVVASLILARPLGEAYYPARAGSGPASMRTTVAQWFSDRRVWPAIAIAAVLVLAIDLLLAPVPINSRPSPFKALAHVPDQLRQKRVFNSYSTGGFLIYRNVPVLIDGRADMYGDSFSRSIIDIEIDGDLEKWRAADSRWHFCWTIMPPERKIVRWLDQQAGWARVYSDEMAVVHARRDDPACGQQGTNR